jgi:hypothetical protein
MSKIIPVIPGLGEVTGSGEGKTRVRYYQPVFVKLCGFETFIHIPDHGLYVLPRAGHAVGREGEAG